MTRDDAAIVLPPQLTDRLLDTVTGRLPRKSFGYLLSDGNARQPVDFLLLESNVRNSDNWKPRFESYGRYFQDHDDAGFVATPGESWRAQREIWKRGLAEVGVFHSHLRHPANFSLIDYELHKERFDNLWHMIISMRNPAAPQMRAFEVTAAGVRELAVVVPRVESAPQAPAISGKAREAAIACARRVLGLDARGRPLHRNTALIAGAISGLLRTGDETAIEELLTRGFLAGSRDRYVQYIASGMRDISGAAFDMGTTDGARRHFCGESPVHPVILPGFQIAQVPVTNDLYSIWDERRRNLDMSERAKPATGVSWFDAVVFALWVGCRLPTEAEWEFACGAAADGEWCCPDEGRLRQYAWYSENAAGQIHAAATREPNALGLFDMHGNVWEWCRDAYEQDFYLRSPVHDPVNEGLLSDDRVCRGGSIHALSEMCRTRYRFHDPPTFVASDLGFRLAKTVDVAQREANHGSLHGSIAPF